MIRMDDFHPSDSRRTPSHSQIVTQLSHQACCEFRTSAIDLPNLCLSDVVASSLHKSLVFTPRHKLYVFTKHCTDMEFYHSIHAYALRVAMETCDCPTSRDHTHLLASKQLNHYSPLRAFVGLGCRRAGPPGIPVLKVKNSPASPQNSRKFPLSKTLHLGDRLLNGSPCAIGPLSVLSR